VLENVWPLVSAGRMVPIVDRELPLPDAQEAHRIMAAGDDTGMILLLAD
jgi:NADPH:quinone reductase-like Zn-dependent oxidoreductase